MKWVAIGLIVLGLGGGLAALMSGGSVRDYVKKNYRSAGERNGQKLYLSNQNVARTAKRITDKHRAADRRVVPEGVFLRYRKDYVSITPRGRGSQIAVVDERRGYNAFYPFVGGYWGRYSGPGESFRGGGPGVGK